MEFAAVSRIDRYQEPFLHDSVLEIQAWVQACVAAYCSAKSYTRKYWLLQVPRECYSVDLLAQTYLPCTIARLGLHCLLDWWPEMVDEEHRPVGLW